MPAKPGDIIDLIAKHDVRMVDFRFTDMLGTWQHVSVPASALDEEGVTRGIGSQALLEPDIRTARIDGFRRVPTLSVICDVFNPVTKAACATDPRSIARRAGEYLQATGVADNASFDATPEFVVFDGIAYENAPHSAGYTLDAFEPEGASRYADRQSDLRSEMALELAAWGIDVEMQHRASGRAGQAMIDFRHDSLLAAADNVMAFKYVVKNVAARSGKSATFMPKPLVGDRGSGMHCRQSLWKDGKPLFFDRDGYAECSQTMLFYIGGLLTHIDAVLAFAAPSTNSYKRLVPQHEAPINVAFSAINRSAAICIPMSSAGNAKAKRLEFRSPDATANPYLAFSAMLLAGLDGIRKRIDPIKAGFGPFDRELHDLSPDEVTALRTVPRSLRESLTALEIDHDFLLEGDVFSREFIREWIACKTERELEPVEYRPHPYEFDLYYDA